MDGQHQELVNRQVYIQVCQWGEGVGADEVMLTLLLLRPKDVGFIPTATTTQSTRILAGAKEYMR